MMNKSLNILAISVLLSACGGGGGNGGDDSTPITDPEVLTGTFLDSPVQGLYYSTPSRSGFTNENGEFEYLAGESITFEIGATSIGGTTAAPIITPFSLTGITPLTKEADILASMTSEKVNSFDRALNIATLLQALDEDGNPDNGIALNNAHEKLQAASVDLFVKARTFANSSDLLDARRQLQLGHRIALDQAVAHVYDSLEIEIESSQIAIFASEVNNRVIETIDYTYDEEGRLLEQRTDIDNDGTPDFLKEFAYDARGNVTRIENSASDTVETMDYDGNDNILSRSIDKPDTANDIEETYSYVSSLLIRLEVEKGSGDSSVTEYGYYSDGQLKDYEQDLDGDGVTDASAEYSYHSDGSIAAFIEDKDNDGVPNLIITYIEDENGDPQSQKVAISENNIPTSVSTFDYDENGNIIRYEIDHNLDDVADYIEDAIYDANNNRTQYRRDLDADGTWDMVAQYRYDTNGNRTRMIEDSDGNGIVDKIWEGNYQGAVLEDGWDKILSQL